MNVRVSPDQQ